MIAAVFLAAFYDPAAARPDTRRMSCVQAQNLVQQSGAVVLSYGQYVYDRFVADRRYCQYYEETAIRVVPAEDTPRCRLLHCRPVVIFPPISPGR
ncbi:MAG: hypothetical protein LJE67_12700 [Salaquimonas sp.]|nr:hypothetical protein [Salaquimonas sp.]